MLVFLHCLLARGAESGQPGSSLWPVYFDWLAEDWSGATGCTKPKHSRRYAYEIYSTFLHEESPLSCTTKAVHPLERLFGIGASTGADPASTVRQAQPLIKPRPGADGAHAGAPGNRRAGRPAAKNDVTAFCRTCCRRAARRLDTGTATCRPGLLARLRMLRQSESAPAAAEASCLATLLVRGLDPELAESLAPGESPMLFGCQHRSVGRQKSLLSRMGGRRPRQPRLRRDLERRPTKRLRVGGARFGALRADQGAGVRRLRPGAMRRGATGLQC
uniref:Sulfhydryl oxidase n=1 Tax=Macrostomum lignano TaxID=282301 RepID=A0A1I8FM81_9PLAT